MQSLSYRGTILPLVRFGRSFQPCAWDLEYSAFPGIFSEGLWHYPLHHWSQRKGEYNIFFPYRFFYIFFSSMDWAGLMPQEPGQWEMSILPWMTWAKRKWVEQCQTLDWVHPAAERSISKSKVKSLDLRWIPQQELILLFYLLVGYAAVSCYFWLGYCFKYATLGILRFSANII